MRMRNPIPVLVLITSLTGVCMRAQDTTGRVVDLPADWVVGTTYSFVMEKGRQDYRNGVLVQDDASTTEVVAEFTSASDTGYTVRWTFDAIEMPASANPLAAALGRITEGMVFDMQADEYGTIQGLRNAAEVRRQLTEVAGLIRTSLVAAGVEPAVVQGAVDSVLDPLLGDGMEAIVLREPMLFTFPSGGSFPLGEDIAYEDVLPFPFTGELIPTRAAFLLESVDDRSGTATLVWRQVLDPAATDGVITRFLEGIIQNAGGDPSALPADFDFDIRDEATFVYDLRSGIPTSLVWSRSTQAGPQRRVDTLRFTTASQEPGR